MIVCHGSSIVKYSLETLILTQIPVRLVQPTITQIRRDSGVRELSTKLRWERWERSKEVIHDTGSSDPNDFLNWISAWLAINGP